MDQERFAKFRFFRIPCPVPTDRSGDSRLHLPALDWFPELIALLLSGRDLPSGRVTAAVRDLVAGRVDDARAAAFLTALRAKGESAEEIAAAALVLREQMVRLVPVSGPVLDTCGTGGDDSGTFNISTAAALVACGTGVPIVKHGNRAVSSKSGSADVLRELGVPIENGPEWAQKCLDRIGFAFCFAPQFHRGMAHVAELRRKLGVRTIFNLLGPLANPASAPYQLLGVGKPELLDPLAGAIAELGTRQAVLVCGADGLDEVSLAAPTMVRIVRGREYESREWRPGRVRPRPRPPQDDPGRRPDPKAPPSSAACWGTRTARPGGSPSPTPLLPSGPRSRSRHFEKESKRPTRRSRAGRHEGCWSSW